MFSLPAGVVNLVTGAGGALVVLLILGFLWLTDRIHSHGEMLRAQAATAAAEKRADEYRKLFEEEKDAHQLDREALVVANDRAEAAVQNARVTNLLLEEMRARWELPRRGHAVEEA